MIRLDWLGPAELEALKLSLRVSFWATLSTLPLGIFVAYALARWRFPGRHLVNGLVHLPLILPPVVTGYLLLLTFGVQGPVGRVLDELGIVVAFRWTGAALAAGIMAFPLMVRAIRLSIEAVDPKLEQAAATLGRVALAGFCNGDVAVDPAGCHRRCNPGLCQGDGRVRGATITFVSNIPGQTQTLPSAVYAFLQVPGAEGAAMRLVIISIIIAMSALLLSEYIGRRCGSQGGWIMTLSVHMRHDLPDLRLEVGFDAPPGVTVLFGRSGSGKTTIVNAVAGLVRPKAGRVAIEDWVLFDIEKNLWLPPHRRRLGYIFQEGRLFPHLTVRQNLSYGRWFAPKNEQREDPGKVIDMLGIGHLLDRRPAGLSGGEKQRVAIGRALLASPRLILADEPLAALDEERKAEILPYFERLRDEVSIPILYVTHSATESCAPCDLGCGAAGWQSCSPRPGPRT